MPPAILIIEPRHEVADALCGVITSANYMAVVRPYVDQLCDVGVTPAAIIVRIAFEGITEPAHAAVKRLPVNRPPVIAIASDDEEVAEAKRMQCEVVLRAPNDVSRLHAVLTELVHES